MVASENYPRLFSPVQLGPMRLKNRVVHSAITTGFLNDGLVSEELSNYYLNRAIGGAAAIIMQPSNMHSGQIDGRRPDILNGNNTEGLKRLVAALKEHDCHILAQIQDSGRGVRETGRNDDAFGASPLPDGISWTVPRALSAARIEKMIEEWAASCRLLEDIGFAGVEISAGHGHLFHQFLSPWSNSRQDQYGGDLAGRARLTLELIEAIRSQTSKDFAIGIKLPGADDVECSIDLEGAKAIAGVIAGSNQIDYWTFCKGTHADSLFKHLPDAHGQTMPYIEEIQYLRSTAPHIPTAALGYINSPAESEKVLTGKTSSDFVMLGRPLIADPAWANKASAGREKDIRLCVSCNTCWKTVINDGRVKCVNNPRVAEEKEADWKPVISKKARKIVIVGAGIAGLETAWVAASRGHKVTLIGKSPDVGGKTRLHARLPGGGNLKNIYDYQFRAAKSAKVKFELGIEASIAELTGLNADTIVLATGSSMSRPDFLSQAQAGTNTVNDQGSAMESGIAEPITDLRQLVSDIDQYQTPRSGRMVIFDKDHTEMTYDAALFFADKFDEVILVTPRERIASDVSLMDRQGIYSRVYKKKNIQIISSSTICSDSPFDIRELQVANVFNHQRTRLDGISLFTYSTPREPNDRLLEPMQSLGIDVRVIGDCSSPRSLLTSTRDGHALGNSV